MAVVLQRNLSAILAVFWVRSAQSAWGDADPCCAHEVDGRGAEPTHQSVPRLQVLRRTELIICIKPIRSASGTLVMTLASFVPILLVRFTGVLAPDPLSAAENDAAKKTQIVLDASVSPKPKRIAAWSLDEARKP